ncbi:DUF2577 domain-containing protein [Paenibacillus apiarius]|uniref:DUF2577 domain-containing protein n=1 Tax=Paenibacillus apiarius TaxID=46240 RepID=A0ABT4DRM8_9BACL|nr:DUF2577 domain-containing protein [Paenibacillus apiarius]MBN3523097.1 DUF2577 domain-containing protein [Paenibacillus apiarius]MCY9516712.1 DUF2577 domain-containing protein [Paenibacillus apiarius]MCY9519890.1 DUF2577 domain-containing protein [Paenibacillus apiarius]MCY9553872.1 DUF2577 domain-containing protein [Paenibacillus apiarius]MCY9557520.1 DUF2577 domain-containing protein [Paenibacillus apiarius]
MKMMLDIIKKAGAGAVEASSPVALLYGEVLSVSPLQVQIDQRFTLPASALVITEQLKEYKVHIGAEEITIRQGLRSGDRLLLARMQGGQSYIALDKVVNA